MVDLVVAEPTPLTHRQEIVVVTVFGHVVEMRDGQDDLRAGARVFNTMQRRTAPAVSVAALAETLAAATGALEADAVGDLAPVRRMPTLVFQMNRHRAAGSRE